MSATRHDPPPLTRRQTAVLEALRDRALEGDSPPTLAELCALLGLRSRGSLHKHVQALVDAGLVEPLGGQHRGVRLTPAAAEDPGTLPLVGRIAAGLPVEAIEQPVKVEVPGHLRGGGECYVLEVRGDSMVDDGILDGDWVVVEKRSHARNGEIVVALIDDEEATLKRIHQFPDRCVLYPANSSMEPMVFTPDRVRVQGVVVGQMRSYR